MKLFFGTYVSTLSADCWRNGAWKREFDINRGFIDEVLSAIHRLLFRWVVSSLTRSACTMRAMLHFFNT